MEQLKKYGFLFICFILALIASCTDEQEIPLALTTGDYSVNVFSNVIVGDTVGVVPARSSRGSVTYTIVSQQPVTAFSIDENYGELIVIDEEAVAMQVNQQILLEVSVGKEDVVKTILVTANIAEGIDCPALDFDVWNSPLIVTQFGFSREALGTVSGCELEISGENPFDLFCIEEATTVLRFFPSESDVTIGTIEIERQPYNCGIGTAEIEGTGTYDSNTQTIVVNYTSYTDLGVSSGTATITTPDATTGGGIDEDGDGLTGEDDPSPNNPCLPIQSAGYEGYDATNETWLTADCDGDGIDNGNEVTNATDPYFDESSDGPCDSTINTAIWDGSLDVVEMIGGDEFTTMGIGNSGCDELTVSGDFLDFFCDVEVPRITFVFMQATANATNGTVVAARQPYRCNGDGSLEYVASGTYDETTQTITLDYEIFDSSINDSFSGTHTIRPN